MHTKIRFFVVNLGFSIEELVAQIKVVANRVPGKVVVVDVGRESKSISLYVFVAREISIARRDESGDVTWETVETVDRVPMRIYSARKSIVISAINPPRGSRYVDVLMSEVCEDEGYFFEPLEITEPMIRKHVAKFDSARLVSAKVRDFAVYEGAVGRFEVTSKNGLKEEIAPFLEGKYYRMDSLTYELTHRAASFLVAYSNNGGIKVNSNHLDVMLSSFEGLI